MNTVLYDALVPHPDVLHYFFCTVLLFTLAQFSYNCISYHIGEKSIRVGSSKYLKLLMAVPHVG